jgi:glutamyl/glutaminyl-tRNA synthetase
MLNFIALLGWSPGGDREIMTRAEMVEAFSLDRVVKSDAKWSVEKLNWMNGQYIMSMDAPALLGRLREYLDSTDVPAKSATNEQLAALLPLYRERMKTLADFGEKTAFFFAADEQIAFDPAAVKKVLQKGDALTLLAETKQRLAGLADWRAAAIDAMLAALAAEKAVGMGKVAQPIRVAVTGTTVSPGIGETLAVLGKARALARIDRTLATFGGTA